MIILSERMRKGATMDSPLRVAIVGAGIGGLAAAQGLRTAGADVRLYERDPDPAHRRQGYRIHISEVGARAMAELVPAAVHRRVVETASRPGDLVAGFDSMLTPLVEQVFPVADPDVVTAVDRYAFRRALMTGLEDVVEFGRELVGHTARDGEVELRFADGGVATADVLVGADGVGSMVRPQLLPDLAVVDIGVRCVYGKIPLAGLDRARIPAPFLRGFCFLADQHGIGGAFAPVLFREPPAEYGDYLMAVVTGTAEALGRSDEELFGLAPEELWALAVHHTATWHPVVHDLMAAADPTAAFPITLRSATRVDPWPDGRVVLLGDAIHPMTPAAGAGANTALRDAARLVRALADARDGTPLVDALGRYRADMIEYSSAVVHESLRNAEQMFGPRAHAAERPPARSSG
jgi:2-polyprenyl-6-methoxyphenol hydroxylase-like FAD-dependent oxidoreductase